jgi:hypothetical protein
MVFADELLTGGEVHPVLLQGNADNRGARPAQDLDDTVILGLFDQDGRARCDEGTGHKINDLQGSLAQQNLVGLEPVAGCDEFTQWAESPKGTILQDL